jgi:hypothetical protein
MVTLDEETVGALNALLEDERASVEVELALANGATELNEREVFVAMGSEEVLACCTLRERLTEAGADVTRRINGIVFQILGTEHYDERLRAFARHQAAICERIQALLEVITDRETRRILETGYEAHVRAARWCEQRANLFAESRLIEFRAGHAGPAAVTPDGARASGDERGMARAAGGADDLRGGAPDRSERGPRVDGVDGPDDSDDPERLDSSGQGEG